MAEKMVATLFAVMQEPDFTEEEEDNSMETFFATVIAMQVHISALHVQIKYIACYLAKNNVFIELRCLFI